MWQKIKDVFISSTKVGFFLPMAYDPESGKPSISLMFAWLTFMSALVSTIALNFTDKTLTASITGIMFWVMAIVFYKVRKLDKFKIDLQNKSIELDAQNETTNGKDSNEPTN